MDILEIYDQHYIRVRKFILAMVKDEWAADDLIQETFLKVRDKVDAIRDPSKISSWIFRVASNLCHDHFRKVKKSNLNESQIAERVVGFEGVSFQMELEQQQMGACVQNHIDLLPESLKTVLVLNDVAGFTHREIADILHITVENVKVRLHRGRKKLRSILEAECQFDRDERNVLVCIPR